MAINGASSVQYNNTQKFLYEINGNSTAKRCYIHSKSSETFFVHGGCVRSVVYHVSVYILLHCLRCLSEIWRQSKDGSQSHTTCIENSPSNGFSMPPTKKTPKCNRLFIPCLYKKVPHIKSGKSRSFGLLVPGFRVYDLLIICPNHDFLQVNSAL